MAAQIRQEINILDHVLSSLSGGASTANERALVDATQYNGTVTYYFEIVAKNVSASNENVTINLSTSGNTSINVPASTTDYTLFRSTGLTVVGQETATFQIDQTGSASDVLVKSARIVIIQNATALTNTETQIEIGNYNLARTAEAATILVNPKYWKYTAANWDGTKTFYAEAVYDSGDMDTVTITIQTSASITAPSWSSVATIVSAATTTVPTRTRVAFTPVDGQWYTIFSLNGSMDNHDIYRAGIVVDQLEGGFERNSTSASIQGGNSGGASTEAQAQAFNLSKNATLSAVILKLAKTGSPTDDLVIDIVTALAGTPLASVSVSGASLTTTLTDYELALDVPVSITAGTTYYIQAVRSPDVADTSNYFRWAVQTSSITALTNNSRWSRTNGSTWGETSTQRMYYLLVGIGILKLEPQYLLANTLFAAGTALQTFLTKWDSTEWDDGAGSIAYYYQAEAANGSTSDSTLQEADGGGAVTNSTLTNIDNAQISAAMTMPTDQNLDVIANANAGDVAAARILVAYTFAAAAAEAPPTWSPQDLIITS